MKQTEEKKQASALTAAAEVIGSTLGKIAVKTGLAKPTPAAPKSRVAPRKKALKAPVKRKAPAKARNKTNPTAAVTRTKRANSKKD
jgi:hypothetical protein